MKEFENWIYPIVTTVVIFIGYIAVSLFIDYQQCEEKYYSFLRKWSVFGSCQLKIDGKYIPADMYRIYGE